MIPDTIRKGIDGPASAVRINSYALASIAFNAGARGGIAALVEKVNTAQHGKGIAIE
ncbi:hypothetical protein [Paraburkholderia tagetis]|uniref:hypothetical protein n=1 Tax=Paraburkholderia tagetis TaxID=2913261 RepID=UPI001EE48F74|nr:hypothetical protein [Paraburkholderia tagetis]